MSRSWKMAAAIAAAGFGCAAVAGPTVVFSDGAGTTGGGVFIAATSDHGTFETFCLEYLEPLDVHGGSTYEYTLSTESLFDGQGQGNSDPLDSRTAFIYQRFRDGEIRNILGQQGLSDERVANAIQIAIWDIEDEPVNFSFHADFANGQALIAAAQDAIDDQTWSGIGAVRVMQNWVLGKVGQEDGARQDTLIIVPLPSGAGLAGVGLLGLAAVSRRRR